MKLVRKLKNQKGQGMVEYALILALIALVVILAFPALTAAITAALGNVTAAL